MREMPYEIARAPASVQQHFLNMVKAGQSERFAEMCALQQPPGTKGTDRAFMEGRMSGSWMDRMPTKQSARMLRDAREAGINPTGKFYCGGIADHRGWRDPEAWVDSTGDVLRVAKKRDLEVHGIVEYVPPVKAPPKEVDINPRILREHVKAEMALHPTLKRRDAIEKVKDRIVPKWKRKK